jgi:hypothetical protein
VAEQAGVFYVGVARRRRGERRNFVGQVANLSHRSKQCQFKNPGKRFARLRGGSKF